MARKHTSHHLELLRRVAGEELGAQLSKAIEPGNHQVVIAVVDGEFTVKRISKHGHKLYLIPENDNFKPMEITATMDFKVWGVVTFVIHKP